MNDGRNGKIREGERREKAEQKYQHFRIFF
jgi:hypothetical protein